MSNKDSVLRSLELIESRITEKLTVASIAESVFFSKNHYQRLFNSIVGESVMEYVTKRKLTLAGRALLETDAAIIDIALDYGFDSREGFARSFKAYMGISPKEYRKYGLTAINKKAVKERTDMNYSKTTDEIIRELNDSVVKTREAAAVARKCELPWYKEYWGTIADKTDVFANNLEQALSRTSAIAEHPDEITGRFNIIKGIDDAEFTLHAMVFSVDLTIARAKPEDIKAMQPICDKYHELTTLFPQKKQKIMQFFSELAALIFEDMRKTLAVKVECVINNAKDAAEKIRGYDYIKDEFMHMADALAAIPTGDMTAGRLNDELFKLPILQFAIDTDIARSGGKDKTMFDGVEMLRQSLEEAVEFLRSLPEPETTEPPVVTTAKYLEDIGYQGNILLFFTRGEAEKQRSLTKPDCSAMHRKLQSEKFARGLIITYVLPKVQQMRLLLSR